jgi:hypothetical protein
MAKVNTTSVNSELREQLTVEFVSAESRAFPQRDADGNVILIEKLDENNNPMLDENGEPIMVPKTYQVPINFVDAAGEVKSMTISGVPVLYYTAYQQSAERVAAAGKKRFQLNLGDKPSERGHVYLATEKYIRPEAGDASQFIVAE